jgi:hypothetical protein
MHNANRDHTAGRSAKQKRERTKCHQPAAKFCRTCRLTVNLKSAHQRLAGSLEPTAPTSGALFGNWWTLTCCASFQSHSARTMRPAAIRERRDEKPKSKTFTRRNQSSSESYETFGHRRGFENSARSDCHGSGIGTDRTRRNQKAEAGDQEMNHEEFKVIDLDAIWTDEIYPQTPGACSPSERALRVSKHI